MVEISEQTEDKTICENEENGRFVGMSSIADDGSTTCAHGTGKHGGHGGNGRGASGGNHGSSKNN